MTGSSTSILREVAWSFVILLLHEIIAGGVLEETVISQVTVLLVPFELVAFTLTLYVPAGTTVSCTVVLPGCAVTTPVRATSGLIVFDSTTNSTVIPIGASIGWRRGVGTSHGVSVYASPAFVYFGGGTNSRGLMRAAFGVDAGVTPAIGVTGGFDLGGTRPQAIGGPSGVAYGLGVSYAFGRR